MAERKIFMKKNIFLLAGCLILMAGTMNASDTNTQQPKNVNKCNVNKCFILSEGDVAFCVCGTLCCNALIKYNTKRNQELINLAKEAGVAVVDLQKTTDNLFGD